MLLPLRPSAAGFAVEACRTSSATGFSPAQCCGRIVASSQPIAVYRPPFFGNTTPRNTTAQHMRTRASDTMSRKSLRRTGAPVGRRLQCRTNAMYSGWEACVDNASGVRVFHMEEEPSRLIMAEVQVYASVDQVWRVITDYERLAEFVPNLERCDRLPRGLNGRVRLRQRGCSQGTLWRLAAEAVLEVIEVKGVTGAREVRFHMLEGDFKEFDGRWVVEPGGSGAAPVTTLRYEISLVPKFSIPSAALVHVIGNGLPANMKAVAHRAEELAQKSAQAPRFANKALAEVSTVILPARLPAPSPPMELPEPSLQRLNPVQLQGMGVIRPEANLPPKGRDWPWLIAKRKAVASSGAVTPAQYLGVVSVPLPPAAPPPWQASKQNIEERQLLKEHTQALYPPFSVGLSPSGGTQSATTSSASEPAVSEVHLRRLDRPDMLHRRAVSLISINATPDEVYAVLTDYARLPEFVPNIALSEQIPLAPGSPANLVRLRQVGYKSMLYMVLHAEAVMDLLVAPGREIQFRQVNGDFFTLQGKFLLQAGADQDGEPVTVLKYAIEVALPRSTRLLGLLEPFLEKVVFEDVPLNLAALKTRVEELRAAAIIQDLEASGNGERAAAMRRRAERPRLQEMMADMHVLAAELQRCYGTVGFLPTREDLRLANRTDLEKAIASHGGPAAVAEALGWRVKARVRRPRGYWDDVDNVRREIDCFIDDYGLLPGVMPLKNDFVRAGRYDLSKVVERWGGLQELAVSTGYAVGQPRQGERGNEEWRQHIAEVAAETGLGGKQGLFELAAKTYRKRSVADSMDEGIVSDSSDDESQPQRYRAPLRSVTAQQAADQLAARRARAAKQAAVQAAAEGVRDREIASKRATLLLQQALEREQNPGMAAGMGGDGFSDRSSEISDNTMRDVRVLVPSVPGKARRKKPEVKTMRREIDEW